MMLEKRHTSDLIEKHGKVFSGPHTNLSFMTDSPTFFSRGQGVHVWDTEEKEYIDFMISMGAAVMGYANQEYLEPIHRQLDRLNYYTGGVSQFPQEVELGEKIVQHVPCAEKVRFGMTGTEVCQLAFRLARAYTGRPYILHFEEHYHGWLDNVQGGLAHDDPVENPFADEGKGSRWFTEGRDPSALNSYLRIPWNDTELLEAVLERWADKEAMMIMEPVWCSNGCLFPRPGYLERARELCDKHGIILCFDEVQTGFRIGLGGAQGRLGVIPDVAVFAKALGGGLPFAAIAGKAEIMDMLLRGKVVGAGTFNGYPIGVVAALSCLAIMERNDGAHFKRIGQHQERLMNGVRKISKCHDVPVFVTGPRGVFAVHFTDQEEMYTNRDLAETDKEKQKRFRGLLAEEGVLILWNGRFYLSAGLTDGDIDVTLEATDRAISRL